MMRFTAFTRVLARWMVYMTLGGILLRLWGEGMFWVGHLVITDHGCAGAWLQEGGTHFVMVLTASLWAAMAAGVLYCVWMVLEIVAMNFRRAMARERQPRPIRR